jgi:hypothetical protein
VAICAVNSASDILDDDAFSSLIALVLFFKGDDDLVVSVEEDDDDPFSRFEEARGLEAVVALLVSLECDWPMQWTGSSRLRGSVWIKKGLWKRVNKEHKKCCEE